MNSVIQKCMEILLTLEDTILLSQNFGASVAEYVRGPT